MESLEKNVRKGKTLERFCSYVVMMSIIHGQEPSTFEEVVIQ